LYNQSPESLRAEHTTIPKERYIKPNNIRVGQRLLSWDNASGYVARNKAGRRSYGPGEKFRVEWLGADGGVEDSQYHTLETLATEGVKLAKGIMSWAK
jgi:hypothetical protein